MVEVNPIEIAHKSKQLTFWSKKFKHVLINVNLDSAMTFSRIKSDMFDFEQATTVMCKDVLLAFKWGSPIKTFKYEEPTDFQARTKTEL